MSLSQRLKRKCIRRLLRVACKNSNKNIQHEDIDPFHIVNGYQFKPLMIVINLHWALRKSNEMEQANEQNKPLEIHNLNHFCLFI